MLRPILLLSLIISSCMTIEASIKEIRSEKEYQELCAGGNPYILMFYSPTCSACKSMKAPYNAVAAENPTITFAKVDITHKDLKGLAERFSIAAVPTITSNWTGTMPKEQLSTMVQGLKENRPAPQESKAPSKM